MLRAMGRGGRCHRERPQPGVACAAGRWRCFAATRTTCNASRSPRAGARGPTNARVTCRFAKHRHRPAASSVKSCTRQETLDCLDHANPRRRTSHAGHIASPAARARSRFHLRPDQTESKQPPIALASGTDTRAARIRKRSRLACPVRDMKRSASRLSGTPQRVCAASQSCFSCPGARPDKLERQVDGSALRSDT